MRLSCKNPSVIVLAFTLAASYLSLTAPTGEAAHWPTAVAPAVVPTIAAATVAPSQAIDEQSIEAREQNRRGITVDSPRVYDDALLQQMLQVAEARLASLQLIDQTQILSRLGATTGASQQ